MTLEQFRSEMDTTKDKQDVVYPSFGTLDPNDGIFYEDIRWVDSKKPLTLFRKALKIVVPRDDPLHGTRITMLPPHGETLPIPVTSMFGRPTPAPIFEAGSKSLPDLQICNLEVDKERKAVKATDKWTTQYFQYWIERQVRFSKVNFEHGGFAGTRAAHKVEWVFRIGHNEHTVVLERKRNYITTSKLCTVTVDGELLVEATPEDLGLMAGMAPEAARAQNTFEVEFDFKGWHRFNFNVWKVNQEGISCGDAPIDVQRKWPYTTKVRIRAENITDFLTATISFADEAAEDKTKVWQELDQWVGTDSTTAFSCNLKQLEDYYCKDILPYGVQGLFRVPFVLDAEAAYGVTRMGQEVATTAGAWKERLEASWRASPNPEVTTEAAETGGFFSTFQGWLSCSTPAIAAGIDAEEAVGTTQAIPVLSEELPVEPPAEPAKPAADPQP
jgi:hypothetical protein